MLSALLWPSIHTGNYRAMKVYSLVVLSISTVFAQNLAPPARPDCSVRGNFLPSNQVLIKLMRKGSCFAQYYRTIYFATCIYVPGFSCCIAADCSLADQAALSSYFESVCLTYGFTVPSLECFASRNALGPSSIISLASSNFPPPASLTSITSSSWTMAASSSSTELASHIPLSSSGPLVPIVSSKNGLSAGAKAGIAIGAIAAILIALLLIFLLLRRRTTKLATNSDGPFPLEAELPTKSNTHEIDGQSMEHMAVKLDEKHSLSPHEIVPELPAENSMYGIQKDGSSTAAINHELDASQSMVQGGGPELNQAPQQTFSPPYLATDESVEVDRESKDKASEVSHTQDAPPPESSGVSNQALTSETSEAESFSRMEELQAKIEKIKVVKERLLKLQELDKMEAAVQREMQEEQRKSMGKMT